MVLVDPLLNPLLAIEPVWAIALIAFILSLFSVFATKVMTDQKKMKSHREELKKMQKKLREASKKDPKKAMKMQAEMMEVNMVVMKESFKPMLLTLIPFLLVFGWLNASFSFVPIAAGDTFTVSAEVVDGIDVVSLEVLPSESINVTNNSVSVIDNIATFELIGSAGEYTLQYTADNQTVEQDLLIGKTYAVPEKKQDSPVFKTTTINNEDVKVHIFKWDVGWFWGYIIFSLLFSIILRKLLKVY